MVRRGQIDQAGVLIVEGEALEFGEVVALVALVKLRLQPKKRGPGRLFAARVLRRGKGDGV